MNETGIKVVIASENHAEREAATYAFDTTFPEGVHDFIPISVDSGVSAQPKNEHETYRGALNRLNASRLKNPEADYHIAFESGTIVLPGSVVQIGVVIVAQKECDRIFHVEMPRFEIPTETARLVRSGMELGSATDLVFKKQNTKHDGGVVGEVTDQAVTKIALMTMAATIAFGQLKNKNLYPERI